MVFNNSNTKEINANDDQQDNLHEIATAMEQRSETSLSFTKYNKTSFEIQKGDMYS